MNDPTIWKQPQLRAQASQAEQEPVAWNPARLYYEAYHAGHHDTVEGQYVDVLPVDADTYWADQVTEYIRPAPTTEQEPVAPLFTAMGLPEVGCMGGECKHASDCAIHNEPAFPAGACDCGLQPEPVAWMSPGKERLEFSRPDTVYGSHTIPLYTHQQASAPAEHTAAGCDCKTPEFCKVQKKCAVGVPDVAELVKRLREKFSTEGVYNANDFMWPLPNLHEEAAETLTALQSKLADHEREAGIYAKDILQQAEQIKEMRELLEQWSSGVNEPVERTVAFLERTK